MEEETLQAASEPAVQEAVSGSFWNQLADFLQASPDDAAGAVGVKDNVGTACRSDRVSVDI